MKKLALLACFALSLSAQDGKTKLKVGDTAPDFKLPSTTGKQISLADYKGQKTVILAFFPLAFTGG
jgi:peroxiredoxin